MARYFGRMTSCYFYGAGYEPWPEQTLVMKCDYCGSHGREFQCRNCGAPVGPKRSLMRPVEVTTFSDSDPVFMESM